MSEQEIIKGCLRKEKKVWKIFIERYSRLVYWAIRKRLAISGFKYNEADIEDIFQEVFLGVFKGDKLLQLKNPKSLASWLALVAANKAVDFMRQKAHCEQELDSDAPIFSDNTFQDNLLNRDIIYLVREIIDGLSDKEKVIISLNLLEEKTHKEIAEIVRIPINSVSTIIARTKEKLRKKLKNQGIGENF